MRELRTAAHLIHQFCRKGFQIVTPEEQAEENAARVVEECRRVFRRAADAMEAKGIRLEDVAIALAYASQDVAARYKQDHHEAIEWLRTCHDLQERQLLDQARRAH